MLDNDGVIARILGLDIDEHESRVGLARKWLAIATPEVVEAANAFRRDREGHVAIGLGNLMSRLDRDPRWNGQVSLVAGHGSVGVAGGDGVKADVGKGHARDHEDGESGFDLGNGISIEPPLVTQWAVADGDYAEGDILAIAGDDK